MFSWENIQKFFIIISFIAFIGLIWFWTAVEKPIVGYYLNGTYSQVNIRVDIENWKDSKIELYNCTYEDAIRMVDELNTNLKER